jgi:hypothetical protein
VSALGKIMRFYKRMDQTMRGFPPYWVLARKVSTKKLTPPPPLPQRDVGEFATDPFASLWNETKLAQVRYLLGRVSRLATHQGIDLFVFYGSLLGHVREGRILPWDDDVDLALFDPDRVAVLKRAVRQAGLGLFEHRRGFGWWLKIFDPTYPRSGAGRWTFPFVDVWVYARDEQQHQRWQGRWPLPPVPLELIEPGRQILFEGAAYLEPARPGAVLDLRYPGWREVEQTSDYAHEADRANAIVATRRIATDASGRKLVSPPN